MADKDFKTIDEQIEILRSRGLTLSSRMKPKQRIFCCGTIITVSAAIL